MFGNYSPYDMEIYSDPEMTNMIGNGLYVMLDDSYDGADLYITPAYSDYYDISSAMSGFYATYFGDSVDFGVADDESYQAAEAMLIESIEANGREGIQYALQKLADNYSWSYPNSFDLIQATASELTAIIEAATTAQELLDAAAQVVSTFESGLDEELQENELSVNKQVWADEVGTNWSNLLMQYPFVAQYKGEFDEYLALLDASGNLDSAQAIANHLYDLIKQLEMNVPTWYEAISSLVNDAYDTLVQAAQEYGLDTTDYLDMYSEALASLEGATSAVDMGLSALRSAAGMLKEIWSLSVQNPSGEVTAVSLVPGVPYALTDNFIPKANITLSEGESFDLSSIAMDGFEATGVYLDEDCTMLLSEGGTLDYSPALKAYSMVYITYEVSDASLAKEVLRQIFEESLLGGFSSLAGYYGAEVAPPEDKVAEVNGLIDSVTTLEEYDAAAAEMLAKSFAEIGGPMLMETFIQAYDRIMAEKPYLDTEANQAQREQIIVDLQHISDYYTYMYAGNEAFGMLDSLSRQ